MNSRARLLAVLLTAVLIAAGLVSAPAASAVGYTLEPIPGQTWTANRTVYDILTVDDRVYIAGNFSRLRNMETGDRERRDRLAAFDRETGALLAWNPGADDTVRSLAASTDGTIIYAGGLFTTAGGAPNQRIAALARGGGESIPGFTASASNFTRELLVIGNSLFAAGAFRRVNGVRRQAVVKLDGNTGEVDPDFNARVTTGRVFALANGRDGRLVIGGTFEGLADDSTHQLLAAVSHKDGAAEPWAPEAVCDECRVLDAAVEDGVVYVATGGPGGRAAAWQLDADDRLWARGADGDVQAVGVEGDYVYFGGHFGPIFSGNEAHQLVALTKGGDLQSWQVPFVGTDKPGIWAVQATAEDLRIGGAFQGVGTTQGQAARYAVFAPMPADPAPAP